MPLAQVAAKLYLTPWNILPGVHGAFGPQLLPYFDVANRADDPVGPKYYGMPLARQTQVLGDIAVIPIHGVLGRNLDGFEMLFFGGCDYSVLDQQVANAADDAAIETIVFDFRSPGGSGLGFEETADRILQVPKRTIAYTSDVMCSAAWGLAAQCDEIYAAGSAQVGSLGTILGVLDSSGAWQKMGLKMEVFRSASLKAVPQPGEALSEEARAFYQQRMEEHHARFRHVIERNRDVDIDALAGAWMSARTGEAHGLVDGLIPSLADLLSLLGEEGLPAPEDASQQASV